MLLMFLKSPAKPLLIIIIFQCFYLITGRSQMKNIIIYCSKEFILLQKSYRLCGWFDENGKNFADSNESAQFDCPENFKLTNNTNGMTQNLSLLNMNITCDG